MLSKKLITLLKTFSKADMLQFGKYIRSPFFNEQEELVQLFVLIEQALQTVPFQLEKETAWKKLFKKTPYKDVYMRRMTSEMTRLAEGYLMQKELKKQQLFRHPLLLKALNIPILEKHFTYALKQIELLHQKSGIKNLNYYFEHFLLEQECQLFYDKFASPDKQLHYLRKANNSLDCYYYTIKLRAFCIQMIYQMVRNVEYQGESLEHLSNEIKDKDIQAEPIIKVYFSIANLFFNENKTVQYNQILSVIDEYKQFFTANELQNFYLFLQNFCAIQINNGHVDYYRKMFKIYQLLEAQNILVAKELKPEIYKNIITIGCSTGEYIWVEQFIKDYTKKLPKEHQENALVYNLSQVYFEQKKYDKVIEQLREVEYKNVTYALGSKLILLKTYFELKEYRVLDSFIDSFRIYARRNRLISKDVRQQCLNSLRFTKKLMNLAPYDKKGLEKAREQIEKCKALAAKKWLLEKVAEME